MRNKYIKQLSRVLNIIVRNIIPGWHVVPDIYGRSSHKQRDIRDIPKFYDMATPVILSKKTMLYYDRLFNIYQAIKNISRVAECRELRVMEVGVYKGGGSDFIASCAKLFCENNIIMYSVDTFDGHAETDLVAKSDAWHRTGTFQETSYELVKSELSRHPCITVVRGRIQDVYESITHGQWDFIHLDVDIAKPSEYVLQKAKSDLSIGGMIIIDDYDYITCPGLKSVVDRFCDDNLGFVGYALNTGQFLLIRVA